jgi:hypothetical protein
MSHDPLSERLGRVLEEHAREDGVTLNELIERTEGRGIFLVLILLCLPFLAPISLVGLSNILGLVMLFVGLRLALELPPRLPRIIGDRPLPSARLKKLVGGSVRFLRFLERWVRPRRSDWMTWRAVRRFHALLLAFLGLILALPIPPVVPLSNTLPSYAIILIAASMMEEDGWLIWAGYAVAVGTVVYLGSVAGALVGLLLAYYDQVLAFLRSWF